MSTHLLGNNIYSPHRSFKEMQTEGEVYFETFAELAQQEQDPQLASDLWLSLEVAQSLQQQGQLGLVVGGYARDATLAHLRDKRQTSKDIDVEVYGATFEELVATLRTFGAVDLVGASFGIAKLINPISRHALDFSIPRRDSKIDKGHKGFTVTGDPNMTIHEAARRRDLTINALALDPLTGRLIDEYGGVEDLKAGILRATDLALFGDDPLRVLRIMQFAGRFNFAVDPATAKLCRSLDLTELASERIGEEWVKLMTKSEKPSVGLEVARELGILEQLHPELAILQHIPQEAEWHPEGDVWEHTKQATDAAAQIVRNEGLHGDEMLAVLFGALTHDLGKASTTRVVEKKDVWRITARGHEVAGVVPARRFLTQLHLNSKVIDSILPIVREHLFHIHCPNPTDKQLRQFALRLLPANIRLWNFVSRADSNGRDGEFNHNTPSQVIYERSLGLQVAEKPLDPIVRGRDLIAFLGMRPGPEFKTVLDSLYEAQMAGQFTTIEEGIALWRLAQET